MNIMLSLAFFFGWLLSFPFNGPVLYSLADFRNFDPVLPGLVFVLFHGLGLLGSCLAARDGSNWKRMMTVSASLSLFLSGILGLIDGGWLWLSLMAVLGLVSGIYIIGWSYPYIHAISTGKRIRFMAGTMIVAYIIYIAINWSSEVLGPMALYGQSMISLLFALGFALRSKQPPVSRKYSGTAPPSIPMKLLVLLCLTVLILFLNGGLMYNIIFPVFRVHQSWTRYLRELVYILALVAAWTLASRTKRIYPIYASCALLGLAFAAFALLKTSPVGYLLTNITFQAGIAFLDLFLWTIFADLARLYRRPARIFGIGLTINVLAIFVGGWTGDLLLNNVSNIHDVVPVYAWVTISTVILLVPYLNNWFERDALRSVFRDLSSMEKKELTLDMVPNGDSLTAKERELIGWLLEGLSNKEIAFQLGIAENTVKTHLKHIYAKTGIPNKNQLLAIVLNTYTQ